MKKITIALVGQGPDVSSRVKAMSYAPFALKAYLDANLSNSIKDRVNIKVFDFDWHISSLDMASTILSDNPDMVGLSVYLWNYEQLLECAQKIKAIREDVIIIFGGPQVSPIADKIMMENPFIDIISLNPHSGEITLLNIIEAVFNKMDFSTINGICYHDNNGNICNTPSNIASIDYKTIPSPYSGNNGLFDNSHEYMAVIEGSRGCPYDCSYCFWGAGKRKIDYFPLERVLRDIEIVYNNPKVKGVYFADSNLLSNISRAQTIISHIIRQERKIKTIFEINAFHLTESIAKLMASLPDFEFLLAVQSANQEALKYIGGLRPSPEVFAKKALQLKQWLPDVKYRVDVMLGLPGDSLNGFIQTLDFVLSLEPFYIVLSYPVYLLPGSRFFENKESMGLRYVNKPPFSIIETPTFPKRDIEEALKISIFAQLLTFYYPAIAKFFYNLARLDRIRIQRLLCWIRTIEEKINLFPPNRNLVEIATSSSTEWNKLKKDLLERASVTESAYIIYSTISELEALAIDKPFGEDIVVGCNIFKYMLQNEIDAIEFNSYELLPKDITDKYGQVTIKGLFSVYKR